MRRPLLLSVLLAGCAARVDPTPERTDASVDGADADATTKCPLVRASCPYMGYGTECGPSCTTPASCVFDFEVDWGSSYCCGPPVQTYPDCACEDGRVKCRRYSATRAVLVTYCEFCGRDASVP